MTGDVAKARSYVRDQFATMKKHGSGHVVLSRADYWKMIRKIVKAFQSLRTK